MYSRFLLPFDILTLGKLEAARTGNSLLHTALVVARLDLLSRKHDLEAKLEVPNCG